MEHFNYQKLFELGYNYTYNYTWDCLMALLPHFNQQWFQCFKQSTLYHVYLKGGQHGHSLDIIEFFFHTMT